MDRGSANPADRAKTWPVLTVMPAEMIVLFCCGNPPHDGDMIHEYAKVSTDGQTVGAQVEALTASGAIKVSQKTASGASRLVA